MSAKPIVTDVNPAPAEGTGDILTDLKSGGGDAGVSATDLGPLSARPMRRISIQTLVVALVLAASGLSLYVMRKQGMGAGMKFKTPAMAPEIDKVQGQSSAGERQILAELAKSSMPAQGDAQPLQKNPFLLDTPAGDAPATPQRDTNAERQQMIREHLGNIKLNSVMDGPHPIARINDRFVSVGDMIDDLFLVAQIHDRSVDFIVDGRTYTLNMGEGAPAAAPKRAGHTPTAPTAPANPRK